MKNGAGSIVLLIIALSTLLASTNPFNLKKNLEKIEYSREVILDELRGIDDIASDKNRQAEPIKSPETTKTILTELSQQEKNSSKKQQNHSVDKPTKTQHSKEKAIQRVPKATPGKKERHKEQKYTKEKMSAAPQSDKGFPHTRSADKKEAEEAVRQTILKIKQES